MEMAREQGQPVQAQLGLWDAVSIIVGIVIGSTIYVTPAIINGHLPSPWAVLGTWALGGVLSLVGALCYAELATAYPRMGGDYVYLSRAFGSATGFLFGWAQLAVVQTSSIGMMAFIFGTYAVGLLDISKEQATAWTVTLAFAAVLALSVLNILGVVLGKWTQNFLTLAKVLGLFGIAVAGLFFGQSSGAWTVSRPPTDTYASFGTALILVLYAYGGWNDAAFVASDIRDRRSIPTTLVLGTGGVMLIYLLINAAYIQGLGFEATRGFQPIAANVVQHAHEFGAKAISVLVMISALGAINGMLFTGSRVCSALGTDHSLFAFLGRWNRDFGSPVWSLLALAAVSLTMILGVGTQAGRDTIDWCVGLVHVQLKPLPWDKYFGGFDTLFAGTAPVFWLFFLLTGVSLFILRMKDAQIERPFKVPFYPILPIIFCGTCLFGLYSAMKYAEWISLLGFIPLVLGLPLYALSKIGLGSEPQLTGGPNSTNP